MKIDRQDPQQVLVGDLLRKICGWSEIIGKIRILEGLPHIKHPIREQRDAAIVELMQTLKGK